MPSALTRFATSVARTLHLSHVPDPLAPASLPGENVPLVPTFNDWGEVFTFAPRLYFRPRSVDELTAFLGDVMRGPYRPESLRVPGSLHSCSDICVADAMLDISALPKTIEFDEDNGGVVASANWTLHDFLLEAGKRGKSLTATGGTDGQTLAGLISTNTAPATHRTTIYELLDWVEYLAVDRVAGTVAVRRVTRTDPDFSSVVCSLGAIGVLTRVRFRLVDQLYFTTVQRIVPLEEILGDIAVTSAKYDFWRINWIQGTSEGLLWAANEVPAAESQPDGDYPVDKTEGILEFVYKQLDGRVGGHTGPLLDGFMEDVFKVMADTFTTVNATGPLRNMLPVDRFAPLHVAMAEWSFDPADLPRILDTCRKYFGANHWPNLPTEIELTKTDSHHMSPWNWPNLDFIVKLNFQYLTDTCDVAQKAMISTHLHGLWNALLAAGIPLKAHWGKLNFLDYQYVSEHYGLAGFAPLIDPMFVNPYLSERVLPPA